MVILSTYHAQPPNKALFPKTTRRRRRKRRGAEKKEGKKKRKKDCRYGNPAAERCRRVYAYGG